jgi:hypothetical protein
MKSRRRFGTVNGATFSKDLNALLLSITALFLGVSASAAVHNRLAAKRSFSIHEAPLIVANNPGHSNTKKHMRHASKK